jgi:hypothetical protein
MRRHIDQALATLPDQPSVLGTAALVAARERRDSEALVLCDRAQAALVEPWQLATIDATRAYVAARQGDAALAAMLADRARTADPDCAVLPLVDAVLS